MGLLSNIFKPKYVQPAKSPDELTLETLTPDHWNTIYQLPHIQELKNKYYPHEDRFDHPDIDNAVIQAAYDMYERKIPMVKNSAEHFGCTQALRTYGIKVAFLPALAMGAARLAPLAARAAPMLGRLGGMARSAMPAIGSMGKDLAVQGGLQMGMSAMAPKPPKPPTVPSQQG